jgi:glycine cleavage system H protein
MSNIPEGLYYSEEDEWIQVEDSEAVIGITDYAQDSLSDIVYVELPDVGDSYSSGDTFGVVESVKAAGDLFMPVGGEVSAINEDLIDAPEIINDDPYGEGWMVKVRLSDLSELESLMDSVQYNKYCDDRE